MRHAIRLPLTALFVASALQASLPEEARGQPGAEAREARLQAIFTEMSSDTGIRVSTSSLFIDHGLFQGIETGVVEIDYGGSMVPVDLRDIRSVHVEGRHPIQGMLWGLGTGILVGSVWGLLVAGFDCRSLEACQASEREGALRWGTVLGTAGAVGGFVIGRHYVFWKPVFP